MEREEYLRTNPEYFPFSDDLSCLGETLQLFGKTVSNRLGIQPLEGFDSAPDGGPTDSVKRRYGRFASGGAGLIWFEACAVSDDGKSNPAQMMLTEDNCGSFQELLSMMGPDSVKVLQLTHSGRMSRDSRWNGIPLSAKADADTAVRYATDSDIKRIIRDHIRAGILAKKAGFDAVDIKVCHGYFLSELFSAYEREGEYGGSFENRSRAIFEIIDGIRDALGDSIGYAIRLNAFDSMPVPYGRGIIEKDGRSYADLSEAIELCNRLYEKGVRLVDISASSPDKRLFLNEPEDPKLKDYAASADLLAAVKKIKENTPGMSFMCTGLSSFGRYGGNVAAGGIREGWFDLAGFGRQALAYPDFANDLLNDGCLHPEKCCVGCNKCFELMDPGHTMTGCVVRDRERYLPLYRRCVLEKEC